MLRPFGVAWMRTTSAPWASKAAGAATYAAPLAQSTTTLMPSRLTGLHLMRTMVRTGKPLAELAAVMSRLPQVLVNVPGVDKSRADTDPELSQAVASAAAELGQRGRILLRPSGTEALVRVMVEAETLEEANSVAYRLAGTVRNRLALEPARTAGP
jgi:hypothetical protein